MSNNSLLTTIRELILSGELLPGQRITEAGLAERLEVSRTPIRNILPRLAAEGFLEPVGRRGFAVKAFSQQETMEALELRSMIEGFAARLLANKGASAEVLAQLDAILEEGDKIFEKRQLEQGHEHQYGEMNERFHGAIINAACSDTLKMVVERLNMVPFVAPKAIVFDKVGLRRAFDMLFRAHGVHHSIVEAIRMRDGYRAEILFREHGNQQRLSVFHSQGESASEELFTKAVKEEVSPLGEEPGKENQKVQPKES